MQRLLSFPAVVEAAVPTFAGLFSGQKLKHFKEYITGLIVGERATVSAINELFVEANDQASLNRFMTEYEWDETALNEKRVVLLQANPATVASRSGCIAIDDVLVHKTGVHIAGAGILYDHAEGKHTLAQNLVTSHYVDARTDWPIDYRQYFKKDSEEAKQHGFRTKIELAIELVKDAEARGVPARCYLFDSWFLCKDVAEAIEKAGKSWISRVKSDRLIATSGKPISLAEFAKSLPAEDFKPVQVGDVTYFAAVRTVRMLSLARRVRLVVSHTKSDRSDDPTFIATNRVEWDAPRILTTYSHRFAIETFYRDAKQYLGLEDCQMRSLRGTRRHWYLGLAGIQSPETGRCKQQTQWKD